MKLIKRWIQEVGRKRRGSSTLEYIIAVGAIFAGIHEVHLSNGKRLDSYDPEKGEIVSRKATDLEMIDIATFETYLKELENKYKPGTKIRSYKYEDIDGQELEGKPILEIPTSNRSFSQIQDYIDLAKNNMG